MEMQINSEVIKIHRNKMAWSQTQLADVSGLSLRTIQRIEKTGMASLESVKAIASVLEISVEELQHIPVPQPSKSRTKLVAGISLLSMVFLGLSILPAAAQPIMVKMQLALKDQHLANVQLLNNENTQSEMQVSDTLKVILTSEREADGIAKISMQLYELSDGKETLIASPVVKVKDRQKAEIQFGDFALSLTPHL